MGKISVTKRLRSDLADVSRLEWVEEHADDQYEDSKWSYPLSGLLNAVEREEIEEAVETVFIHNVDDELVEEIDELAGEGSSYKVLEELARLARLREEMGEWE